MVPNSSLGSEYAIAQVFGRLFETAKRQESPFDAVKKGVSYNQALCFPILAKSLSHPLRSAFIREGVYDGQPIRGEVAVTMTDSEEPTSLPLIEHLARQRASVAKLRNAITVGCVSIIEKWLASSEHHTWAKEKRKRRAHPSGFVLNVFAKQPGEFHRAETFVSHARIM